MILQLKDKLGERAFSGTVLVTTSIFIGSVLGYVLQLFLGRFLSPEEYGEFNSLLSLVYILLVPVSSFSISLVKLVSELKAQNRFDVMTTLFSRFTIVLLLFGLILIGLFSFFGKFVSEYLKLSDSGLIFQTSLYVCFAYLNYIPHSYLQGLLRFKAFSFYTVVTSALRLVLSIAFVLIGLSVSGIFSGMTLGIIASFFLGLLLLNKNKSPGFTDNLSEYYKKIASFSASVILINVSLAFLNNIDIILVKHHFSAEDAGIYAAVVTLGKVILFGTGAVTVVMFPQITELYTRKENFIPKLKYFLSLQVLLLIPAVGLYSLVPGLVINTLFPSFGPAVPYLPVFSLFISLYVLVNFFVSFLLSIDHSRIFTLFIPAVVLQFLLINYFHESLFQVIFMNMIVTLFLLASLLVYFKLYVSFDRRPGV